MLRRLGGLHIRGSRPGFLHDLTKLFRILQHGAGLHHVVVEGLAIMVSHEQRRAHDIQQALLADIGVGIVDECAGIGVPIGIDMQIATPTRDAAVDELRVVLEVHAEQRLAAAVIPDAAIDLGALFRRGQKLGRCVIAHRHVMEVPAKVRALFDEHVVVFLRGDGVVVGAGVAAGNAVNQLSLVQDLHRSEHSFINALAAAGVGGLSEALQRNGRGEILHAQHLVSKSLVDQRAVGEGGEHTIIMLLAQPDDIFFSHQRLAACEQIEVDAHLLALADDVVKLLKAQVQLVAVLSCPAAHTVQVAGGGGVKQDGPGDIAIVLCAKLFFPRPADEVGVDKEVYRRCFHDLGIYVTDDVPNIGIVSIVGVFDRRTHRSALSRKFPVCEFVRPVHELDKVGLRILIQHVKGFRETVFFQCGGNGHGFASFEFGGFILI